MRRDLDDSQRKSNATDIDILSIIIMLVSTIVMYAGGIFICVYAAGTHYIIYGILAILIGSWELSLIVMTIYRDLFSQKKKDKRLKEMRENWQPVQTKIVSYAKQNRVFWDFFNGVIMPYAPHRHATIVCTDEQGNTYTDNKVICENNAKITVGDEITVYKKGEIIKVDIDAYLENTQNSFDGGKGNWNPNQSGDVFNEFSDKDRK